MRTCTFALALAAMGITAEAGPITIINPSFETATLPFNAGNGSYNQLIPGSTINPPVTGGTLAGWTASSNSVNSSAGAFDPNAGGVNWTTQWWNGNNVAYLQESALGVTSMLSETLGSTLQNNTAYTLSSLVGCRSTGFYCAYAIQLYAGTTLLASASNLSLTSNTSGSDSAMYTSGASDPNAGAPLMIVLSSTAASGTTSHTYTEAFFDSVSLNAQTAVSGTPEPGTFVLLGLGLAAIPLARRRR